MRSFLTVISHFSTSICPHVSGTYSWWLAPSRPEPMDEQSSVDSSKERSGGAVRGLDEVGSGAAEASYRVRRTAPRLRAAGNAK